ncbi:type II toxin-antitoxin system VapC family toxin [Desulfosarcina sp. OttesenSCG-928-A07]|nr:type II toxin-antitoxin system VapC family toxin [Desulfosarcina sp. OttesenSCG-928-G17]MDL2328577.1 type II toxin-antitoxin system VapC family toxin [Desulfosarcina sp. OttesenSCG-928-A07]
MRVLLDTNICIYMIKNNPPHIRKHFERFVPGDIAISVITVSELQYGVEKSASRKKNAAALEAFLLPLDIVPFDRDAAFAYGRIRAELEKQGQPIGGMDMLIAAHAIALNAVLVTHNLREFQRIPDLVCETWVE